MRPLLATFALVSLLAIPSTGANLRADGSLEVNGLRLVPYASTSEWWSGLAYPSADGNARIDFLSRVAVRVERKVNQTAPGSLAGEWTFYCQPPRHPGNFECGLMAEIRDPKLIETIEWSSDAGGGSWKHPKRIMPNWALKTFTLKLAGQTILDCRFNQPAWVHLYDRGDHWILRIGRQPLKITGLKPGQTFTYRLGIDLAQDRQGKLRQIPTFRIDSRTPGWTPITNQTAILKASPLDHSHLRPTRAPCGSQGPLILTPDGHFAFQNTPSQPVRFYGINLCYDAQYANHAATDQLLNTLQRMGYNALRLHHWEVNLVRPYASPSHTPDPQMLDRLCYLIAGCSRRGLYLTTDLFVSRTVTQKQLGKASGERVGNIKDLIPTDPAAFEDFISFAVNIFGRVNPYTGRRICEDPAWIGISLINEPLAGRLSAKQERDFLSRARRALKERLGWVPPITDLNATGAEGRGADPVHLARDAMDYVDYHLYIDHPSGMGSNCFACPSRTVHEEPGGEAISRTLRQVDRIRLAGKPFVLSEFNWCAPNARRAEGLALLAEHADGADWSGLWRFSWANRLSDLEGGDATRFFFLSTDPLGRAAERIALAIFLRRGRHFELRRAGKALVGIQSLDGRPIRQSARILVSHLTEQQNDGATWLDETRREYLSWGALPHLIRDARTPVFIGLDEPSRYRVWALAPDGARLSPVPSTHAQGRLRFLAETPFEGHAVLEYEVARDPD